MSILPLLLSAAMSASPAPSSPAAEAQDSVFTAALAALTARADSGESKAIFDLAGLYDRGYLSLEANPAEATRLYIRAAEAGYAPAQNFAGYRLISGIGLPADTLRGIYWLEKAALQGDPRACNNLGSLLAAGEIVEQDYAKAAYWLQKAAAEGVPTAQASLADLYKGGLGVERDTLRAVELYDAAIAGGLADAGLKLQAMMYPQWRQLPPAEAVALGRRYYSGVAPFVGVTLFEIAAEGDNPSPDALALLADAYSRALGVDYDYNRSLSLYLQAARLGNGPAQFVIGELLQMFPDALEDFSPAPTDDERNPYYWLERAAAVGITDAALASRALLSPQ